MGKEHERTRRARFVYEGFGFPVILLDVPVVRVRGAWTPDVNFNELGGDLLELLASMRARLTGNQVRFIRQSFEMTLEQFAGRFGVTHPAVIKWEKAGDEPTVMTWAVEKDIRLEVLRTLSRVKPSRFLEAYSALKDEPSAKPERVSLQVGGGLGPIPVG